MSNTEQQIRPSHYGGDNNPFEPIKIIQYYGLNFEQGNVIKYTLRAGLKGSMLEDLRKARTYLDFEIAKRERAEMPQTNAQPEESYGFGSIPEDKWEQMQVTQLDVQKEFREYRLPEWNPDYTPINGAEAIAWERLKQVQRHKFTIEHDANFVADDELAMAAMYWAFPIAMEQKGHGSPEGFWPINWKQDFAKRRSHTRIEQLAIAGALIAAEIDRLKRMEDKTAHADMCEALNLEPARQYKDQIDLYHKIIANHPAVPVDENAGMLTDLDIHQMRIAQQEKAEGQPVFDVEAIQKQIDLVNQEQPTPKKYDYRATYETAYGTPTCYERKLIKETEDYILLGIWFCNQKEVFELQSAEPCNTTRLQMDFKYGSKGNFRTWLPIPEGWSEGKVKVVNGYNYFNKIGMIPEAFTNDDKAIRSFLWGIPTANATIIRIDNPGKKEAGK